MVLISRLKINAFLFVMKYVLYVHFTVVYVDTKLIFAAESYGSMLVSNYSIYVYVKSKKQLCNIIIGLLLF